MAIVLNYGNIPIKRGRVQLGEQVRTSDVSNLIQTAHERWACSGESAGGIVYDRAAWTTTLTSYNVGSNWTLDRYQPMIEIKVRHNGGVQAVIAWRAFVANCDVQVQLLNSAFVVQSTTSQVCTSAAPQWIGQLIIASSLNVTDVRHLLVTARRASFDTVGSLYHFGAINRPNSAIQIPGQP